MARIATYAKVLHLAEYGKEWEQIGFKNKLVKSAE